MWHILVILFWFSTLIIKATPPVCDLLIVLRKEEELCAEMLSQEEQNRTSENDQFMNSGRCAGMWDNMSCWPSSSIGQTVNAHCPEFFQMLTGKKGFVHRNCTSEGWSETFPRPDVACGYDVNDTANEERRVYFMKLKTMYTVGYSTSLGTLTVALGILASFRRLAKSTLLLVPLFGIHYIIFAFFPEDVNSGTMEIQLFFELALGSFQGFIVAVLYCFLNGEVQLEIHRKWRQWHLSQHIHLNQHLNSSSSNGGSGFTQVMQMMKPSPQEQKRQTIQKSSVI
ncbi:unnamed protein product [Caretta caretta]